MTQGRTMKRAADEPEIPVVPPGELELPYDDGEPMESNRHRQQMVLLIQALKRAYSGRHDFFVDLKTKRILLRMRQEDTDAAAKTRFRYTLVNRALVLRGSGCDWTVPLVPDSL